MWKENDSLIEVAEVLNGEGAIFPVICPSCGSQNCHAFMYNPSDVSKFGSIWVWCDSCKGFVHFRGLVPEWAKKPDFIDENQLCADVKYLHSVEGQIDSWLSKCFENERTRTAN